MSVAPPTGTGETCGVWGVSVANGANGKGRNIYPAGAKEQVKAQETAVQDRLLPVY